MRISNSVRLIKQRGKRVNAVICVFTILLGFSPLAYADSEAFNARMKHIESRPESIDRHAESIAISNLSLLVVYGTEKVTAAKAMLNIDGSRQVLDEGQTSPEGVTLVSADSDYAVVEINGRHETLTLSMAAVFPGSVDAEETEDSDDKNVSLWEGPGGFFYADGAIEDYPVHFLLDTGANTIAISSGLARRIGLNYEGKQQKIAKTVGGTVAMVPIILKSVSVGHITLHDVLAGIFEGPESDAALLGMSFLGQVDMVRTGKQMELKVR